MYLILKFFYDPIFFIYVILTFCNSIHMNVDLTRWHTYILFIIYSTQYFFLTLNWIVCHSTFSCNKVIYIIYLIYLFKSLSRSKMLVSIINHCHLDILLKQVPWHCSCCLSPLAKPMPNNVFSFSWPASECMCSLSVGPPLNVCVLFQLARLWMYVFSFSWPASECMCSLSVGPPLNVCILFQLARLSMYVFSFSWPTSECMCSLSVGPPLNVCVLFQLARLWMYVFSFSWPASECMCSLSVGPPLNVCVLFQLARLWMYVSSFS